MTVWSWIACACAVATLFGLLQMLAGCWAVRHHVARRPAASAWRPAVTVLKPLFGDEPLLENALESFFVQAYPAYQIVFGVADANDGALQIVASLCDRYPSVDVSVVIDPAQLGSNRKVGNLANMLRAAKHTVLVISDSDMHVRPDYLQAILSALGRKGTGLVTTVYAGHPACLSPIALLAAAQINQNFLPGALLGRLVGRRDCLGATMALRRETLDAIGGFAALADHLADDNRLGRLVALLGLRIDLAATMTATTVPETCLSELIEHELRWARTMRVVAPAGLAGSVLQYPLAWAMMAFVSSGGAAWTIVLVTIATLGRALAASWLRIVLHLGPRLPWWLLPFRDVLSIGLIAASFAGTAVVWRGHSLQARASKPRRSGPAPPNPRLTVSIR